LDWRDATFWMEDEDGHIGFASETIDSRTMRC